MENIQQIVNSLIDEKAKENNTIDLNAYAIGALDALEKSNYTEMLEMLIKCKIMCDHLNIHHISNELNILIKEATEL
jgi:queuine/archaeosine tRNA-ribosyltransferase